MYLLCRNVLLGLCVGWMTFSASANVFFKVTHKNAPNAPPSYLLGTMHLLCKDEFQIPDQVYLSLVATEQLIVEVDITDTSALMAARPAMFQQPRNYLKNHLNDAQYSLLEQQTQHHLQRSLATIAPLRPMIISSLFLANYLPCESETISVDETVITQAISYNKPVLGLESAVWQLELFDQIDLAEQVSALYDIVADQQTAQQELTHMASAYLSGDGEKLNEIMMSQEDFLGASAIFLDQRNQTWAKQLPSILAEKPSFIAVGAGHLYGEQGLLTLLQAQGFQITPIPVRFGAVGKR
ncbi:MAG: TraB/GumN family protein [Gammaproteobacteria bacterium]|nr:TraB/GumN family protein [Gammaproteobacteria bacterium]